MAQKYILAIDQGTTGSRAFVYNAKGQKVASAYREFKQYYPKPGWVEHDADEIWQTCVFVIRKAFKKARVKPSRIAGIGITNQRETTVLWDRKTGKPCARAIVWQCRRTAEMCQSRKLRQNSSKIKRKTGLVIDAYFSGTKIAWLLAHVKGLRAKAKKGNICFGTIDSWLIYKLTKGKSHATDVTNASRTLIFNIKTLKWDPELLRLFNIPKSILPEVKNSGDHFGVTGKNVAGLSAGIPIYSVLGDQQAALYGQGCYTPGTIKNTYGTGCFIVLNTGKKMVHSKKGLLTTVASDENGKPVYAMEGSIFMAGAVMQWLRDEFKIICSAPDSEKMIKGLKDTNGVYLVPAFTGLGAPYWDPHARGAILGLTRGANARHVTRAALESICYQTKDVFDIMQKESGKRIQQLKVDGGACNNDFLMQFQADILNCKIIRPQVIDSTVHGAALLAGVMAGLWKGKKALSNLNKKNKVFRPRMTKVKRTHLYDGWINAVQKVQTS